MSEKSILRINDIIQNKIIIHCIKYWLINLKICLKYKQRVRIKLNIRYIGDIVKIKLIQVKGTIVLLIIAFQK